MRRRRQAAVVPEADHDRQFKELLMMFFIQFLELFFSKLAAAIERDSIEFVQQEYFAKLTRRKGFLADLVVKVRFKDREKDAFFLIHVEHQSTAPAGFPQKLFRYWAVISEHSGLPVYPIVVYSHDRPRTRQPDVYRVAFPDGEVLRFRYRVVQLNRLSWRRFLASENPVASALMAKMNIAERDRLRVLGTAWD